MPFTHANGRDPQAIVHPFHPQGQEHFRETVGFLRFLRPQDPYLAQGRVEHHPDMAMVETVAGQPHGHGLQPVEIGPGRARCQGERQRQGQRKGAKPAHVRQNRDHGTSLDRTSADVKGGSASIPLANSRIRRSEAGKTQLSVEKLCSYRGESMKNQGKFFIA